MDPISIVVEIEIATLVLAGVGAFATWLHHKGQERADRQRERQHQELKALHERHHVERMQAASVQSKRRGDEIQDAKTR